MEEVFDPVVAAGRLMICKKKCEHCGQYYGLHDGGKQYHETFVCDFRQAPDRPSPKDATIRAKPHIKDRRRSSCGAPDDLVQAQDLFLHNQRAAQKQKLVHGWYDAKQN